MIHEHCLILTHPDSAPDMLQQRVITVFLLLLLFLPALFYPDPAPFFGLALLLTTAATWEWARLNGMGTFASLIGGAMCGGIGMVLWWADLPQASLPRLWLLVSVLWVLLGGLVLRLGVSAWCRVAIPLRLLLGWAALVLTWLAVAQARWVSVHFLLSVLALVWAADTGAYFAGRAWGGRWSRGKLAPSISPGKSWEGVWGGMVAVVVLALAWQAHDVATSAIHPGFYTHLGRRSVIVMLLACTAMAAMSVLGDLVESLVKRSAGVKDSSALLPGHGGVLDRMDALLPTLPMAMMLYSIWFL